MPNLIRAENTLEELGVKQATYLWVPEYHGLEKSSLNEEFKSWCNKPKPHEIEWFLHGYFHKELDYLNHTSGKRPASHWSMFFKYHFLSGGEAEFLSLSQAEINERLKKFNDKYLIIIGKYLQSFL